MKVSRDQHCNPTRTQQESNVEFLLWQQTESSDGLKCHLHKILQVNKVMSILFYVIFLAYLRGIQGNNMDQRSLPEDSLNSLIIKLIQADILKNKLSKQVVDVKENYQGTLQKAEAPREPEQGEPTKSEFQPVIAMDTELLRQQRRYNSPRVLLSESTPLEPPPLYLMEDYVGNPVVANRTSRRKRYAEHKSHRGEYSVCDSESLWVTDKSSAIDIRGHQVTVLGEIKTGNSPVKQYFYETRCKEARPVKNGCRGIDDKHWNSQCKTSQTYVRALTSENNKLVGWRWIRIDTSCVCALSRKIGRT
ncbi:Neurotrophin-3 [Saguinus oedipus]|uniref:Neurotrophin-3 n=1 Tax=Saguinus oedipus TaxID=9490 RepID=A0ABQ9UWG6_SAGOE|nr:Neurotrophin-3 [Saguinus oedipus]